MPQWKTGRTDIQVTRELVTDRDSDGACNNKMESSCTPYVSRNILVSKMTVCSQTIKVRLCFSNNLYIISVM
jgi:hypothetical protein